MEGKDEENYSTSEEGTTKSVADKKILCKNSLILNNTEQKQRGRPPKFKTNKKISVPCNKLKRQRGRPPKSEVHKEISDIQKKKRGRPPKCKSKSIISSQVIDSNNTDNNTHSTLQSKELNKINKDLDKCKDLENSDIQVNSVSCSQKRKRSSRFNNKNDTISDETNSECVNKKDTKIVANSENLLPDFELVTVKNEFDASSGTGDDDENNINYKKKRKLPFNMHEKRKPGRPKGVKENNNCNDVYVPHHSQLESSSKKEKLKQNYSTESDKMVSCGKCSIEILKSKWPHHNLSLHNDLSWIEGTLKPDFENDEKLLKRVLFNAIKKRKGHLICEKCNLLKRSVLGFLSHATFCGKDEEAKQALMVTCPVCKAVIKPSSLEYHERMHKTQTEEKKNLLADTENINLEQKTKRKAAQKAVSKISEFNALVYEDKDDKDNARSPEKQNSSLFKKFIQKPQLIKKISSNTLKKWQKTLDTGESAICNQKGCQFKSTSLEELKQHYLTCNFTPRKEFLCKICKFQILSESEIIKHVLEKHPEENNYDLNKSISDSESYSSGNISESDNVSDKNHDLQKKLLKENTKSLNRMFKFLSINGASCTKFNKTFFAAFQWTLEFEKKNYKLNLFEEFVSNKFTLLSNEEFTKYLPETEESMLVKNEKMNNPNSLESEWKKWKRFEGHCIQDIPTCFVGGPIWALAWLPIPTSLAFCENISQFLAISTHPTMDIEYSVQGSYPGKNIIQIWDFGDLNNKENSICNPKLAYAIAHEGGTVWCLDWCPSGCYQCEKLDDKPRRMGLLAAACSDGCIRVYSPIFPEDLPSAKNDIKTSKNCEDNENIVPIYYTEPVLMLIVNLRMYDDKEQNWQVTKLSWTKEENHNIIVAGYSNGYIALWDLVSKSPMLKYKRDNTIFFQPYKHFFAHHHAVTMVHLIPQDNKRFLATASIDRYYKFWDLEDVSNSRNCLKKSFVTDGSWLTHWSCALIAYDDALSMNHNYSYCVPLREYTYKYYNILPTNSTSYSIATSDFGNSIAHGTLAGEVVALFPQQLLYIRDMEKHIPRKRYVVSLIEVTDFEDKSENKESTGNKKGGKKNTKGEYIYMPSTYEELKDRFGLNFSDKINLFKDEYQSKNSKNKKKVLTCEMLQKVPIEQYSFASVNRLAWNPNAWSFLWLAAGYQNGFLRLISFKSLASTDECNKLLATHIDEIKILNALAKSVVISSD